jgi:alcohol dehydrogenase, propanol-preferring
MLLDRAGAPLRAAEVDTPSPRSGQVLIRVRACGVCRTDLHIVDGELTEPKLPLILGHEIAGEVVEVGEGVEGLQSGDRVGVPWLGWTCGRCTYCEAGQENLCEQARFTGYSLDGGYAEYVAVDARYCFTLPDRFDDTSAAPLLCAGLIGYRSYRMAGDARRLGLYGFGAAAHILCQLATHEGRDVYAFTREGDEAGQAFARSLGAVWAGGSGERPPEEIDAAIIFAPVGALVVEALRSVRPGGTVVCGGIHMSDIPAFPYELLWRERVVRSVANLTRDDGVGFMRAIANAPLRVETVPYALDQANAALDDLRAGRLTGAAVLIP